MNKFVACSFCGLTVFENDLKKHIEVLHAPEVISKQQLQPCNFCGEVFHVEYLETHYSEKHASTHVLSFLSAVDDQPVNQVNSNCNAISTEVEEVKIVTYDNTAIQKTTVAQLEFQCNLCNSVCTTEAEIDFHSKAKCFIKQVAGNAQLGDVNSRSNLKRKRDNSLKSTSMEKKRKSKDVNINKTKRAETKKEEKYVEPDIVDITEELGERIIANVEPIVRKQLYPCCCCVKTFDVEDKLKNHVREVHTYTNNEDSDAAMEDEIKWDVENFFQSLYVDEEYTEASEEHINANDLFDNTVVEPCIPDDYMKACSECADDFYWVKFDYDPITKINGHQCYFTKHGTRIVRGEIVNNKQLCLVDEKAISNCQVCTPMRPVSVARTQSVTRKPVPEIIKKRPVMKKKTKTVPIVCLECNIVCKTVATMEVHIKKEHTEKPKKVPLSCPDCSETFTSMRKLNIHVKRIHTKRYSCPECSEMCKTIKNLNAHMKKAHVKKEKEIFKCPQCTNTCNTLKQLQSHVKKEHVKKDKPNEVQFKCPQCTIMCNTIRKLDVHVRKEHLKKKERPVKTFKSKKVKSTQGQTEIPYGSELHENNQTVVESEEVKENEEKFSCCCCNKTFSTEDRLKSHIAELHTYTFNLFNPSSLEEEISWNVESYFQSLYEENKGVNSPSVDSNDEVVAMIGDDDYITPEEYLKACKECPDDFYWLEDNHVCFFVCHGVRVLSGRASFIQSCIQEDESQKCMDCEKTLKSMKKPFPHVMTSHNNKRTSEKLERLVTNKNIQCLHCKATFSTPEAFKMHRSTNSCQKSKDDQVEIKKSSVFEKIVLKTKEMKKVKDDHIEIKKSSVMEKTSFKTKEIEEVVSLLEDGDKPCCCCKKVFKTEDDLKIHVFEFHEYKREVEPTNSSEETDFDAITYFESLYAELYSNVDTVTESDIVGEEMDDHITPEEYFKACLECPDDFYWPEKNHVCLFVVHETRILCGETNISQSCLQGDSSNNCENCSKLADIKNLLEKRNCLSKEISDRPSKANLKQFKKEGGAKPTECKTCGKIFSSKQYLAKHESKAHVELFNTPTNEPAPIKIEVDPTIYSDTTGIKSEQPEDTSPLEDEDILEWNTSVPVKIEVTPFLYSEVEGARSDYIENQTAFFPVVEYSDEAHSQSNVKEFDFTVDNDSNADERGRTDRHEKRKQGPKIWIPGDGEKGVPCTDCGKLFKSKGPMLRHFEDMHQSGEFPCKGCGKVFTSKNKMSSHFSRNCKKVKKNLMSVVQLHEGNEEIKVDRGLDHVVKNDLANFEFEEFSQYRNKLFGS